MKGKYYITNQIAVNYDFRVQLARTNEDRADDDTSLMAAPIIEGLPESGAAVYLSTNGDPVLIGTWINGENVWSIWDEESAEDSTEDHPNNAGYMRDYYGIAGYDEIETLMIKEGLIG